MKTQRLKPKKTVKRRCRGSSKDGMDHKQGKIENHFLSGLPSVEEVFANGRKLADRFEVKDPLGTGGFGIVFQAYDVLRMETVAIKILEVGASDTEIAGLQLQREMIVHSKISDFQHVIKIHDLHFLRRTGTGFLVLSMEYANGGTFRKWLLENIEDSDARRGVGLSYFKQACRGVEAIHSAGTMHLDLKPENLLFSDGVLKVCDFGSAHCAGSLRRMSGWKHSVEETGTAAYMSPEQFLAPHPDDVDSRADIYSLGIILFELLHPKCRPPFGGTHGRLRDLHLQAPVPGLPGVEEAIVRVVERCLKKKPADRYQDVRELLDALEGRQGFQSASAVSGSAETLDEIVEKASVCLSNGDMNEAAGIVDGVLGNQPDHPFAKKLRQKITERFEISQQLYHEIAAGLERGNLLELTQLLQEAMNLYPDHPSAPFVQMKLAARVKRFRGFMEEGLGSLEKGQWESALDSFQGALPLHPSPAKLKPLVERLSRIKGIRENIEQALIERDFKRAAFLAQRLDQLVEQVRIR